MKRIIKILILISSPYIFATDLSIMQTFENIYNTKEDYYIFLYELSSEDAIFMAKRLRNHKDGQVAYAAANLFIKYDRKNKAIPIIATLITSGRGKTDLNGRMGYDWAHLYGQDFADAFLNETLVYILTNISQYNSIDELNRIDKVLQLEIKYGTLVIDKSLLSTFNKELNNKSRGEK